MHDETVAISDHDARRLAIRGALLSGDRLAPDRNGVLAVVRGLGRLQIDPTRTVEKTHLLVLWSRLGGYDRADLDALLADRSLFEHQAFIFPRESLAERKYVMERRAEIQGAWAQRIRDWLAVNEPFRHAILDRLASDGPLPSRAFTDDGYVPWPSSGWTNGRNVSQMFEMLDARGEVMVAGRRQSERLWHLPERVLPEYHATSPLSEDAFLRQRVADATRRLGVATARQIVTETYWAPRPAIRKAITQAVEDGDLTPVTASGLGGSAYTTPDLLEALDAPDEPRTTLLSPFDPLIKDRDRTLRLFGFHYRLEMYVPKAERRYGHFVLPILHDDRLVGRIDPHMDRKTGTFTVRVFAEADAPMTAATGAAIGSVIRGLGSWLGADRVTIADEVPAAWRRGLT